MADFFKRRDVQALLSHRKILFLGDSNVRPLYKDLISSLKHRGLISIETLKYSSVESYFGDIAVQQCGRKNEWTFWENRIFEEGACRVELFCTGHVMLREIQKYLCKLHEVPSLMPDIVYVSFSSYGKTTWISVYKLLDSLKMKLPSHTLVLVGSSFATARDMFGDPRFEEVPFFATNALSRDNSTEDHIAGKATSLGFHNLNTAYYLKNPVFRGMATQPGCEAVIVRYCTFLLLTYISNTLRIKTPGRVNQDVLLKAIASAYDETDFYNSLLLKHANDWLGVKSHQLNTVVDSAGRNAREVTQMLWDVYDCSRERGTAGRNIKERRQKRQTSTIGDINCRILSPPQISSAVTSSVTDETQPRCELYETNNDEITEVNTDSLPDSLDQRIIDIHSEKLSISSGSLQREFEESSAVDLESENDDNESLEEGEIRSPVRSPVQTQVCIINDVHSDISSSEDEIYANHEQPPSSDSSHSPSFPPPSLQHYYNQQLVTNPHSFENYFAQDYDQMSVLNDYPTPTLVNLVDPPPSEAMVIVVSDEEPYSEENEGENAKFNDTGDAIINLNSDDSEDKTYSHGRNMTVQPTEKHSKRRGRERSRGRVLGAVYLRKTDDESLTSWPSAVADTGPERLWMWWRKHIEGNDGSLELHYQTMLPFRAIIPRATHIPVPKIIDDVRIFLRALGETKFPPICDSGYLKKTSNKERVLPALQRKLQPLAEEISRGSVKRINFEISYKKKPSPLITNNRICIKEFASIRNLLKVPTKKAKLNFHSLPEGNASSFYSYGEQNLKSVSGSSRGDWSPLGPWIPITSETPKDVQFHSTKIP